MTTALEDYALIGDGETAALVSAFGAIDWLCLPRFDSPACCAALLGDDRHGFWCIAPQQPVLARSQRYQPGTLIVETEMPTAGGTVRITDFMPVRQGMPMLVRLVEGLEGCVEVCSKAAFRFDYGRMPPWSVTEDGGIAMHVGPDKLLLRSNAPLAMEEESVVARFSLSAGERCEFMLTYNLSHKPAHDSIDVATALAATQRDGRDWIGRLLASDEAYDAALRRSLLTLKALIHRPTGGLVAAATTSLPEQPGGPLNWDYRYCWLRDAAFTFDAFLECGFVEEAIAWRDWILRAVAGAPELMQIVYRVDGSRRLDEAELGWLPGYRFARPVRLGNAAAVQMQLDVWGELLFTLHMAERAGMARTAQGRHLEHAIVDHVARVWRQPDQGLWESRGAPRHYVYSKAMAWVAIDCFLRSACGAEITSVRRAELTALRQSIHDTVCAEGFDPGLNSFTAFFGSTEVDASLLLLPKIGFLPMSDPRMQGTLARVEARLVRDGFVHRHEAGTHAAEGAFLACSCWLAECLLGVGRRSDAVAALDAAIGVAGRTGLLAEEYDLDAHRLAGNLPQALSHLAVVQAILALRRFDRDKTAYASADL